MFENVFSSSMSVWAGLLGAMVAIPILIHLINLMRHRTVRWAAMDFLIKSHRKHRNWVWLKQLFLLLSRIAALVLALLMLAQIGCDDDRVARLLGGSTTHHYVIVDDSFSMEDRGMSGRAFDRARSTLSSIVARAKNRQNQKFTLLRFSSVTTEARKANGTRDAIPAADSSAVNSKVDFADIDAELVDTQFDRRVEALKGQLEVSQQAVGPEGALALVADLVERRSGENAIVYVLSDFRQRDWDLAEKLEPTLAKIEATGAAVELINCVETQNSNLAITRLAAVGNVRVAATPLMVEVEVRNFSDRVAENVEVSLVSTEYAVAEPQARPERLGSDVKSLPSVFIDSIPPGKSIRQSFPVFFAKSGEHTIVATLPADSVAADNRRFCTVAIKPAAKVLLVDNDAQLEAQLMSLVLNPGGITGLESTLVTKQFLRDASVEQLAEFDVVFMLDVDSLDEVAVKTLEDFVAGGGGVAFFAGPNANAEFYRDQLFRNGEGVFPVELGQRFDIPERLQDEAADVDPIDHPIFAPALSVKNSLLGLVQVKSVWKPTVEWLAQSTDSESESPVDVLATVRGMQSLPLVVEKRFGNGRSIAIMTTAGPTWNNWMRNATFVPIMLLMQNHLAAGKFSLEDRLVGELASIRIDSNGFQRQMMEIFRDDSEQPEPSREVELRLDEASQDYVSESGQIGRAGIQETWLMTSEGAVVAKRTAFNVDTDEGDLARMTDQQLLSKFSQVSPTMVQWDQFNPEPKIKPASSLNQLLFGILIVVLIVEQCLAYLTNYHRG